MVRGGIGKNVKFGGKIVRPLEKKFFKASLSLSVSILVIIKLLFTPRPLLINSGMKLRFLKLYTLIPNILLIVAPSNLMAAGTLVVGKKVFIKVF